MTIFAADLPDHLGPSQQINIAGLFLLQLRESNELKSFPGTLGPRNPQSFFEMQLRLPFRARCRNSTPSKADLKLVPAKVLELARYLNTSSSNSFQSLSIYQRNHASSPKLTTGTLLTCVRCAHTCNRSRIQALLQQPSAHSTCSQSPRTIISVQIGLDHDEKLSHVTTSYARRNSSIQVILLFLRPLPSPRRARSNQRLHFEMVLAFVPVCSTHHTSTPRL